jgi:hypothetical protein
VVDNSTSCFLLKPEPFLPNKTVFIFIKLSFLFFLGKVSTPHGWVDVEKVVFAPPNPTNKQTKNWSAVQQQQQVRVHSNELTRGTTELVELVEL